MNQLKPIPRKRLGARGPIVGALGLGCVNLTGLYGERVDRPTAISAVNDAIDVGMTLFDTADSYGANHANEIFVGEAIASRRDEVAVSTKFGVLSGESSVGTTTGGIRDAVRGDYEYVRSSCEASLKRLGVEAIDVYYLHRPDPKVPIEETVGAMGELVEQGKVRHVGLCEPSAATLRRAHATYPITALQSEWSLFTRDIETAVLPVARELGVGIVPFAPLGRGFLTGKIKSLDDLPSDDARRSMPRFENQNFERNLAIVDEISAVAAEKGCTPAQVALAWLCAQGQGVVPIPGSDRPELVAENAASTFVDLTTQDLARIDLTIPRGAAVGDRYSDMSWAEADTPALVEGSSPTGG